MDFDIEIRIADEGRPDIRDLVSVNEFEEGQVFAEGGLSVSALRVDHPPVTECYALRFEHGGRSVVFSADTAFFPPLAAFANGADILVHEAMLEDGRGAPGRAHRQRRASQRASARQPHIRRPMPDASLRRPASGHLVLNHLIPADDPEINEGHWIEAVRKSWSGALTIGRDGLVVPLADSKPA